MDKLIYIGEEGDFAAHHKRKEICFDRFSELKLKENWTVGPGRIDAIRFQFKRAVKLTGFKCFDNKNMEPYGVKYQVLVNMKKVLEHADDEYSHSPSH